MIRLPASASLRLASILASTVVIATSVAADPQPTFVRAWGPNPNEVTTNVTRGLGGHVYVGIQIFATEGIVNEFDSHGPLAGFPWLSRPPGGLAVDGDGSVYVSLRGCNCVQKLTEPTATWGDTGSAPGEFMGLRGIAIDADGFVYAADLANHRIQKLTLAGNPISAWGTYGTGPGDLGQPFAIAVDGTGHVYVTDVLNDKVLKYTTTGTFVTEWGDSGAALGQFHQPTGISADGRGGIFVADQRNHRIQKFTDQGALLVSWGEPDSLLGYPMDVAADGQGLVWVADFYHGVLLYVEGIAAVNPSPVSSRLALETTPNPFRDRLALRWTQPVPGPAEIVLEDVSGRRIATLASRDWGAGRQELAWSAASSGIAHLPAGIYWIRVSASGTSAVRRVVHLH